MTPWFNYLLPWDRSIQGLVLSFVILAISSLSSVWSFKHGLFYYNRGKFTEVYFRKFKPFSFWLFQAFCIITITLCVSRIMLHLINYSYTITA